MPSTLVCGVHSPEDARVVRWAAQFAQRLGLRFQILHVAGPDELPSDRLLAAIEDIARIQLDGDDVDVLVASGEPEHALADAASGAEMLVIGGSETSIVGEALHGSIAASLTRAPPRPVVVVPRDDVPDRPHGGVVCGVRDRRDLACATAAARIAARLGAPLSLVHVLEPVVVGVSGPVVAPPIEEEAIGGAGKLLDELSSALADDVLGRPDTCVLTGPPGPELARVAADRGAALLAVGASERGSFMAAVAGATSRYASRHAGRPVVVCPRGEVR